MASEFALDPTRVLTDIRAKAPVMAQRVTDAIRAHAPVGKDRPDGYEGGALREGLAPRSVEIPDGVSLQTVSDRPYAKYVIGGTGPHLIEARTARALRFWVEGGDIVFAKRVNHPGTAPNPFYREAKDEIDAIVRDQVRASMAMVLRP